jgi:hypothetical protein
MLLSMLHMYAEINRFLRPQVGANDSIGECSLNLASLMRKAYMTKKTTALSERWLPFMHPNFRSNLGS